jgi:hypothetical protein
VSDEVMNCAPAGFQLMNSDAAIAKQMRAAADAKAGELTEEHDG